MNVKYFNLLREVDLTRPGVDLEQAGCAWVRTGDSETSKHFIAKNAFVPFLGFEPVHSHNKSYGISPMHHPWHAWNVNCVLYILVIIAM